MKKKKKHERKPSAPGKKLEGKIEKENKDRERVMQQLRALGYM